MNVQNIDILIIGGLEMKAARESQITHGLYHDEDPYSGTGHLFSKKVRVRYEIVPDIYVADLYNVAKRAAKVLKNFTPKVVVFSVGLKDLTLGLSPLDVHKRILGAVYKIFNKQLFPVCGYFIPVLLFKPLHWGLQLNVNVEEARQQMKQNVNMLNLLLDRDFTHTVKTAGLNSFRGAFTGSNPHRVSELTEVGAAKMLSCLVRDLGGALHFLKPCSDFAMSYNQSCDALRPCNQTWEEYADSVTTTQLNYLNQHHSQPDLPNVRTPPDYKPHPKAAQWAGECKFLHIPAYAADHRLVDRFIRECKFTQSAMAKIVCENFRQFQMGCNRIAHHQRRYHRSPSYD